MEDWTCWEKEEATLEKGKNWVNLNEYCLYKTIIIMEFFIYLINITNYTETFALKICVTIKTSITCMES